MTRMQTAAQLNRIQGATGAVPSNFRANMFSLSLPQLRSSQKQSKAKVSPAQISNDAEGRTTERVGRKRTAHAVPSRKHALGV
jgi:hypothetical protein